MTELETLQKLTGESDTELLNVIYSGAKEAALAYMNRTKVPKAVKQTVIRLAVIQYNRLGTEGESSRNEAGLTTSFTEMPENITSVLKRYRLARVGGKTYEADT